MKLPERLAGLVVGRDGRPLGSDLPSLDERGAADAWRATLGPGPFYVRFVDRVNEPSLARIQRVARLGEVWLDCAIPDADAALDLLIAGAARLVLWSDDAGLVEAVGDSGVLGWDGTRPLADVLAAAAPHDIPVVATAPLPSTEDPGLYQAPPPPWTGPFAVRYVGNPANLAGADEAETAAPVPDLDRGTALL